METIEVDGKKWRVFEASEYTAMVDEIKKLAGVKWEDHDIAKRALCDWCGEPTICFDPICFGAYCDSCMKKIDAFWDDYHRKELPELGNVSTVELVDRHRNFLLLDKKWFCHDLAIYLAGQYKDVWSSRSESGRIAGLFGADYLMVYCGSSSYIEMMLMCRNEEMLKDFEAAMEKDRNEAKN